MAYKIMRSLMSNRTKTEEELLNMADVYYAAGRLTGEQYTEIVGTINQNGTNTNAV